MTFTDDEKTVHDAEPVELYEFTGPSATFTYRYTSHAEDYTFNTFLYTAIPIKRNNIVARATLDKPSLQVTLPITTQLVQDYAFGISPRSLTCKLYREHPFTGNNVTYWAGTMTELAVDGENAVLTIPSKLGAALGISLPTISYQSLCNHVLYDARCTIDDQLAANKKTGTVQVISGGGAQISLNISPTPSNDEHQAGDLVRVADGERRLIMGNVGNVFTLNWPFRTLSVSDSMEAYRGCDHTVDTCKTKFTNEDNFGGFPYIPSKNPFKASGGFKDD